MTLTMETEYVEGCRPEFFDAMLEMNGTYYGHLFGLGPDYVEWVRGMMLQFAQGYDPRRDLLLTAHRKGRLVGSIAVEGTRPGALLHWLLVDPAQRGLGIGKELLHRALEFCRDAGHAPVTLWTVEELPTAVGMYKKIGFRTVERAVDTRYGTPLTTLRMELNQP